MGIVGVLLAGGCPYPTGQSPSTSTRGQGARFAVRKANPIRVGSSVSKTNSTNNLSISGAGARVYSPQDKKNIRVLVVAPSNAAVNELVVRLCEDGVPGPSGGVIFPKVVRIGEPREKHGQESDAGVGGGSEAGGGRAESRQAMASFPVVDVCCVLT